MRVEVQLLTRIREPGDRAVDRSRVQPSFTVTVSAYTRETALHKALPKLIKRLASVGIDINKPRPDIKPRPKPTVPAPPHTHIMEKRLQMAARKPAPKAPAPTAPVAPKSVPKAPPMEVRAPVNMSYIGMEKAVKVQAESLRVRGDGLVVRKRETRVIEVDPYDDLEVSE